MNNPEPLKLDVRAILAGGGDPFSQIMAAKSRLRPGQALELIAPFEPQPLYSHFTQEGYGVESQYLGEGVWRICFVPATSGAPGTRELDLRALEPPAPLQKSLEAVAKLPRGETLVLRTRFRPVHLFEELDGRGFDWEIEEEGNQNWVTHLWRVPQEGIAREGEVSS